LAFESGARGRSAGQQAVLEPGVVVDPLALGLLVKSQVLVAKEEAVVRESTLHFVGEATQATSTPRDCGETVDHHIDRVVGVTGIEEAVVVLLRGPDLTCEQGRQV
jgi:hypothetical protein